MRLIYQLSCLWWFGWELNTHHKCCSCLDTPVCVWTSDRSNRWQVENNRKCTYKIRTPKRGRITGEEKWHYEQGHWLLGHCCRCLWTFSISKHDGIQEIPVTIFSFQWKQSCTPKIWATGQESISGEIKFPRRERLSWYLQSNWNK